MKHTLTAACIFLKSVWQAVCRPFSDQFRRLSTLRSGSLRSALTALLLVPLTTLHAADDRKPVLIESKRIWDKGQNNSFTDLTRFRDRWFCCFREGIGYATVARTEGDSREAGRLPAPDGGSLCSRFSNRSHSRGHAHDRSRTLGQPSHVSRCLRQAQNHHVLTHTKGDEAKAKLVQIDRFHMEFYAYVVERLKATSLLDSTTLVMGSGISDGDQHNYADLQVLFAGGGWNRGHFHYEGKRPLADLWLTMAHSAGVQQDRFADSTGILTELA